MARSIWPNGNCRGGGFLAADFDEDFDVDGADFLAWQRGQGLGNGIVDPEQGDGNNNGTVEGGDFLLWQTRYGTMSAWYMQPTTGVASFAFDAAPVVTNVAISGSISTDDPYDFATMLATGEQLRTVPVAGADTISIHFSEEVSLMGASSLLVTNLDGTSPGVAVEYDYDYVTQTATWRFENEFADGRHFFTIDKTLGDLEYELLDGDIDNPWTLADASTAAATSGDGETGGAFRFRMTILSGDTDRDNIAGATDYTDWASYEPGLILVSTTADEIDGDLSLGDVSLREAIQHANATASPTTVLLPEGRYKLTRVGTEYGDATNNDLDITGHVIIAGVGAGRSVIESFGDDDGVAVADNHIFYATGAAANLTLSKVTLTGETGSVHANTLGAGVQVEHDATFLLVDSAVVNLNSNIGFAQGVRSLGAHTTILRSVFTENAGRSSVGVAARPDNGFDGSFTLGDTIFALNTASNIYPNIHVSGTFPVTNLGGNLYDNDDSGFFTTYPGVGDHFGTTDFVVTTVADTFDHTNNVESLSLREAVDLANADTTPREIWVPAWGFVLTRDRGTQVTDTDTSYGDLDIKASLVIRGVSDKTSVAWTLGITDAVFDLLGDYAGNGIDSPDNGSVTGSDFLTWQSQNGSTNGVYSADGDDDGDVDQDDYDIWSEYYGNTLGLFGLWV